MRELLAGLVPGLPQKAVAAIVARADGIPLYAVETVRMLLAQGRLTLEEGVYRPTGDLDDIAVPETLTALIAARLDGLDPADRALVADAAVLGQSFTLAAWPLCQAVDAGMLEPRLAGLVRRELLAPRSRPALARARPVRLRPGAHPRGRLQHAVEEGPQGAPPRRRPLLRGAGHRRSRRRPGRPLPRRVPGGRRGRRGGRARGAGAASRFARRGRTRRCARLARAGGHASSSRRSR